MYIHHPSMQTLQNMAICRGYAVTTLSQLLFFAPKLMSNSTPTEVIAVRAWCGRGRGGCQHLDIPGDIIYLYGHPGLGCILNSSGEGCTRMPKWVHSHGGCR